MEDSAQQLVTVGRVSGIFGIKGWLRIFSFTDPPQHILHYEPWHLGAQSGRQRIWRVLDGALHGRGVIARLEGVEDRDVARGLIGELISVPRECFAGTREGEYYWSDLIGLRVIDEKGVETGRIVDMLTTSANDVMVVVGDRRRLVPFLYGTVVRSVDLASGAVHIVWDDEF